jgi:dienelactone hydrolase
MSAALSNVLLLGFLVGYFPNSDPPFYPDKTHLLVYRDANGKEHAIQDAEDWARRREHILANMQLVMGPLPDASRKVPVDMKLIENSPTRYYVRLKITYLAEKGDRVPAYLFIPSLRPEKLPAVLCLHQTVPIGKSEPAGLGDNENLQYALDLVKRGYVTLAPDYPSFGDYQYDFTKSGYSSGTMKAIWNNMRAVDLLESLPIVDAARIGCIGHSLGGHNTIFTTVFDTRIKVAVSNCGFTSFAKYKGGDLKGWTSDRYMPRIATVYHSKPAEMPFDFSELVAAIAPRAFLACAPLHDDNFEVSGVRDVIAAAQPVYALLGAAARLAAHYPDCGHEFPPESRKVAYEFLDRWLRDRKDKP